MEQVEHKECKSVVDRIFCINIMSKSRSDEVVFARIAYAMLMKRANFSASKTGRYIKKNHSTILHYYKKFKELSTTNEDFYLAYVDCHKLLFGRTPDGEGKDVDQLCEELAEAKKNILSLSQLNKNLREWKGKKENEYATYAGIFDMIKERVKREDVEAVKILLVGMLNTYQEEKNKR